MFSLSKINQLAMALACCSSSCVTRRELSFCWPNRRQFNVFAETQMLDVFTSRPPFRIRLCEPRIELLLYGKTPHWLSVVKRKRLGFGWEGYIQISRKFIFEECSPGKGKTHLVKAIATVEPEVSVHSENFHRSPSLQFESKSESQGRDSSDDDSIDMEEKERLRRMRISKANKGNVPWNKGRKHSPETLQRIRERTKLAMQDPKVKMKLVNLGHAQSEETRIKIGVGVREGWQRRREMLMVQEGCLFEWQNVVAEASREGYASEDELQWDSYQIIDEQLKQEWLESLEKRKTMPWLKGSKRAPKSPEQRRKISEAISAKWADPEYRGRVCSALAKYHGVPVGGERKRRRRPRSEASSAKRENVKRETVKPKETENEAKSVKKVPSRRKRNATPSFKDPLASSKLEMIRKIRADRAAMENKKKEATERAKLLIAEAEKAAKALEVAALKSPLARASLIETRKLIAEATRSIKSIESGQLALHDSGDEESFTSDSPVNHFHYGNESSNSKTVLDEQIANGSPHVTSDQRSREDEVGHGYPSPSLEPNDIREDSGLKDLQVDHPKINGAVNCKKPQPEREGTSESKKGKGTRSVTKTKKWVCGRLVEVDE